jgi:hypothetical protein
MFGIAVTERAAAGDLGLQDYYMMMASALLLPFSEWAL